MSPVIKSADPGVSGRVRPLTLRLQPIDAAAAVVDPETVRLRADLEAATAALAVRDAEIERLKAAVEPARLEAEARGHAAGLAAAADLQAERLQLLEAGVLEAASQAKTELAALERLAPALAREGLARLVGDAGQRGDLLQDAVLNAVRQIDAEGVVRVEVAAGDFADLETLSGKLSEVAHRRIEARPAADLQAGQVRLRLVLGDLEVGLDQQWDRLARLFDDLAEARA